MFIVTVGAHSPEFPRHSEGDVIELEDGRLLLAYMEFSGDGSDIALTRIVARESGDGGRSWERHRVLVTTAPGDLNVYSPNLIRAADGGILLVFMRQKSAVPHVTAIHVWKSADEGASFAPFAETGAGAGSSLCNGVIKRLSSGRLLLPACRVDKPGSGPYDHTYFGVVPYSDDDGATWKESAGRLRLPMRGVMEPHVEETGDGRVAMVVRSQLGSLFMAESEDGGDTWSKPQPTGLRTPESCPELVRIPSTGDLAVFWNNAPYDPGFRSHFGKRSPLSVAVSRDGGRTWGPARDIETDPRRGFSNPGCRFLRDGRAVLNYWTCEYTPDWVMKSDSIDLRVAILEPGWLYAGGGAGALLKGSAA